MKVLKYLSLAALSMCFASCSEDNSVTLKVETELGGLSEFVTVKDQEVVIKMTDEKEDGVDCKVITSSLALEVSKSVAIIPNKNTYRLKKFFVLLSGNFFFVNLRSIMRQ